jgi:hypothetical protein
MDRTDPDPQHCTQPLLTHNVLERTSTHSTISRRINKLEPLKGLSREMDLAFDGMYGYF